MTTHPKGELMPQTKQAYLDIMERDAIFIEEQAKEIKKLNHKINQLQQKLRSKRGIKTS